MITLKSSSLEQTRENKMRPNQMEQTLTDIEIATIEMERAITDNEIAIYELQKLKEELS